MTRNSSVRFLGLVVALATGFVSSTALADTITCTSVCNFGPGDVLDNLNVKNGGVATLDGTHVTGNIVVEDGGALFVKNGVDVEGNVQSFGGSEVSVLDAVIGGSVQIKNTPRIRVENSTIAADLQLEENSATGVDTPIALNSIGGNLQLYKNNFADRAAQLLSNDVYGNLQLVDNRGGTIRMTDNYVESAMQCTDNDSVLTGSENDVGDLECPNLQPETSPGGAPNANPDGTADGNATSDAASSDDGATPNDALFPARCGAGMFGTVSLIAGGLMLAGRRTILQRVRRGDSRV